MREGCSIQGRMISVYTFFTWDITLRDGKHEGLCGSMSGIKDRWLYLAQAKFANLMHFPFFSPWHLKHIPPGTPIACQSSNEFV